MITHSVPRTGGDHVGVGLPRPSGKRCNEHAGEPIGQDGRMTESGRNPGDPASFGRVDPDGTVYVRTAEGERSVGQVPDVPADEATGLLHPAVRRPGARGQPAADPDRRRRLSPDDALASVRTVRTAVADANAVGDLDGLLAPAGRLLPVIAAQRAARRAERARQQRGDPGGQGAVRARGRAAGRRQRLARRGQPVPGPARPVEGAAPAGPGHRRRALAPLLQRPDRLHPPPQGPVRQGERGARGGPGDQGTAGRPRPRRWRPRPTGARPPARTGT